MPPELWVPVIQWAGGKLSYSKVACVSKAFLQAHQILMAAEWKEFLPRFRVRGDKPPFALGPARFSVLTSYFRELVLADCPDHLKVRRLYDALEKTLKAARDTTSYRLRTSETLESMAGAINDIALIEAWPKIRNELRRHGDVRSLPDEAVPTAAAIRACLDHPWNRRRIESVTELWLFNLDMPILPADISRFFPHLKSLDIGGQPHGSVYKARFLSPIIGELSQLQRLDLTRCGLTRLPDELFHLSDLRRLILDDNRLSSFPEGLRTFPLLTEISLSCCHLDIPHDWIATLATNSRQRLTLLNLVGNTILYPEAADLPPFVDLLNRHVESGVIRLSLEQKRELRHLRGDERSQELPLLTIDRPTHTRQCSIS